MLRMINIWNSQSKICPPHPFTAHGSVTSACRGRHSYQTSFTHFIIFALQVYRSIRWDIKQVEQLPSFPGGSRRHCACENGFFANTLLLFS